MRDVLQPVEAEFLSKIQASLYTGISTRALDLARGKTELPFYRHGTRILFRRADLDVWMEKHLAGVGTIAREGAGVAPEAAARLQPGTPDGE
ncbi:MAG TPA: helix-turn-helix domain-containing protein [Candidatus Binatia bacterium]|nr:helix-turn-helix domain-containing protein [Candidatus Binatia bacterium]